MATDPLAPWWVHQVTVERHAGEGPDGDTFDAPVTVAGFVNDERKLVRAGTGEQVVSETQVSLPKGTPTIPVGSRITLPAAFDNRETVVLAWSRFDGGGLPTPDHCEVALA